MSRYNNTYTAKNHTNIWLEKKYSTAAEQGKCLCWLILVCTTMTLFFPRILLNETAALGVPVMAGEEAECFVCFPALHWGMQTAPRAGRQHGWPAAASSLFGTSLIQSRCAWENELYRHVSVAGAEAVFPLMLLFLLPGVGMWSLTPGASLSQCLRAPEQSTTLPDPESVLWAAAVKLTGDLTAKVTAIRWWQEPEGQHKC